MPERITRQVRLSQSSSRFVTPTWIIFSSLTENCLASGFHISKSQRLLNLLRAPREVDWERHLSAKRQMVLWCFAYDDLNHSRWVAPQLLTTSNFIGPWYHAALLFSGLGSIVLLFGVLFSQQIREDLVRTATSPYYFTARRRCEEVQHYACNYLHVIQVNQAIHLF